MLHSTKLYSNTQIAAVLSGSDALTAMRAAHEAIYRGNAAVQARSRIALTDAKFSTMSAILATERVAAVKLYTTLAGQFRFYIALMSLDDGRMLALMEGDELTRLRTAATTVLAATHLARANSRWLGVAGCGVQARAHVELFIESFGLEQVSVFAPDTDEATAYAQSLRERFGINAHAASAEHAASADIVVLATRASTPVIHGVSLQPGSFVASIGATRPDQREMDDACIERATEVVVDWTGQALAESGDFLLLHPAVLASKKVADLADVVGSGRRRALDCLGVVVYKAVGNALQDAAIAALAYARLNSN
ncbi:ornithine cyclodeaminase [Burkholderia sp. WP9]|uniref:ornithine cyclodeaminase family protein n=1 Tax=Burkholderia sp. WP9 TaxID=1500263 RepID=UPI000894D994|nr:ornithine cyclodeaminase family protein [Burkholderia sp. WP9]SEE92985.1 ornithine cyclodeaminase [Burkholderia sp. WP9]